jgi:hypothetical protein
LYTPLQHGAPQHVRDELCASISHRRRCLGARGASPSRARRRRQCTRTARARRRRLRWFQTSLGGRGIGRRGHTCCLFAVYFSVCLKLLYKDEQTSLYKVLYTDTRCVTALHSYRQLYSAIHFTRQPLQHPSHRARRTRRTRARDGRARDAARGRDVRRPTHTRVTRLVVRVCDEPFDFSYTYNPLSAFF